MDYKEAKEKCLNEIEEAEKANETEKVEQLKQELGDIEAAEKESERLKALLDSEEAKSIKYRDILSDYFMKEIKTLNKSFIARLKETALREPVTVDEYGSYRKGLFTFGCFIVEVDYSDEEHIWEMTIYHSKKGLAVPHDIVKQACRKFIPDHCVMAELYYGRNVPVKTSVTLFEVPGGYEEPESDQVESKQSEA